MFAGCDLKPADYLCAQRWGDGPRACLWWYIGKRGSRASTSAVSRCARQKCAAT